MKKSTFEYMIKNPPRGATHYRKFKLCVVFYKNVDISFGSYDKCVWWASEKHPDEKWTVLRNFLNENLVVEL